MACDFDSSPECEIRHRSFSKPTRWRSQELLLKSEEDLIDSLFYECDKFSKGTVPVPCLVDYLRKTAGDGLDCDLDSLDDLGELAVILDPESHGREVDLHTYRTGIKHWIRSIRERNQSSSSGDMDSEVESSLSSSTICSQESSSCPSPRKTFTPAQKVPEAEPWVKICVRRMSNGTMSGPDGADCSYGSLEASGDEISNAHQEAIDNIELANRLANFQHHNKKLSDENVKLQLQLEVSEDATYQKAMEIEELEKKIWIMQDTIDKSKEILEENEELKSTISQLEDSTRQQQMKMRELEKERSELEEQLNDSKNKFLRTLDELHLAKSEQEELLQQFNDYKIKYDSVRETNDNYETDFQKHQDAFKDMNGHIEHLIKSNECLKKEKLDLEKELNQTRQDYMYVNRMMSSDLTDDEEESGSEHFLPVKIIPCTASTPTTRAVPSILSEIKDSMRDDDASLPSPLIEKPDDDVVFHSNLDNSSFDVDREVAAIMNPQTTKIGLPTPSKIVRQFHQKMDAVLQLVHQVIHGNGNHGASGDVVIKQMEKNIHYISRKLAKRSREKDEACFQVTRLKQVVQKLKVEKDEIDSRHSKAMKQMEAMQKDETELQAAQLEAAVYQEEANEMNETVEGLLVMQEEKERTIQEMKKREKSLREEGEKRIKELESANLDLAEKCHQTELALKEELSRSHDLLLEEFKKSSKFEESLALAALTHHGIDLKELWRLAQKDVDNECSTSEESAKTLSLGDVMAHCRESPSSPLVEALILEKFKEAAKDKTNKQNSASIHSFLSTKETSTSTASLVSRQQHAQSCPLLPANATLATCSTQTDEATDTSNSISGLSTTESFTAVTSECVNMQVNSIGQSKCLMAVLSGQDMVQSVALQPALPQNSVALTQSPGLSRERSSSFKAAIEKSQMTPVQPQYYPTEAEIISSTDTTPDIAATSTPLESFRENKLVHLGNTEHSNLKAPMLPMFNVNFSFSELANNSSTGMIKDYSSQLDPFSEEIRSSFVQEQDGEEMVTEAGLPDADEKWASPRHNRKLSVLIEEGSDAEAEESLTESVSAVEGLQSLSPAHQRYSPASSRQSSTEEMKVREKSPSVLPPEYKSPPEYRKTGKDRGCDFRLTKQDHISPGNTPRNLSPVNVPSVTESTSQTAQSLSPKPPKSSVTFKLDTLTVDSHGKPKSPPSPFRLTTSKSTFTQLSPSSFSAPFPGLTTVITPSSPNPIPQITRSCSSEIVHNSPGIRFKLEKSHSDEGVRNFGVQTSPILLRAHLFHSHSNEESDMPRPSPLYSSPPEYKRDLSSASSHDDADKVELSEADKLLNAQILEEAKKASLRRHNRRPRRSHSNSDTSTDNSMSLEDDYHSLDSQDYPQCHISNSSQNDPADSSKPSVITTSKKLKSLKGMRVGFDITEPDSPADVKREILQGLNSEPTATDFSSSRPSKGGQLAKIREEHLKKRGLKHVTMPELAETSETESVKGGSMDSDSDRSSHGDKMLEMNITENPIYPSLPDHFLKKIGAARNSEVSPDQLSDHELEEKFASLSLAFKTDRQTLEQRVQLQERARDMAEQNVEREMEGIRKTVKNLGQFGSEADYRDLLNKLQQHLEVLEQSTARVSSRAELLGAVQQEDRMSRAIDIMVNHNDSLKQRYDRLLQELEESRKLLQENRILPPGASGDFDSPLTKRSLSLAGGQSKAGKRRASVAAFPRLFGSLGSSSGNLNPKQRFQNVIANTTVTNSVTSFLRRSSHERSLTPPPDKSTPTDDKTSTPGSENDVSPTKHTCLSPDDALPKSSPRKLESSARKTSNSKKVDEKEEVFQKGFEQGVRTSISAELGDLREQQTIFCENLEHLMEENQTDDEDDEEAKEHFLDKMWQYLPEWDKSGKKLRLVIGGIAFMMGIFTIILTVQQVTSASRTNISLEELVAPYVQYRYFGGNKPA